MKGKFTRLLAPGLRQVTLDQFRFRWYPGQIIDVVDPSDVVRLQGSHWDILICDDLVAEMTKPKENEDIIQENPPDWVPTITIDWFTDISYLDKTFTTTINSIKAWISKHKGKIGVVENSFKWYTKERELKITFYQKEDYLEFVKLFPYVLRGDHK